jgi:hypothetical protein
MYFDEVGLIQNLRCFKKNMMLLWWVLVMLDLRQCWAAANLGSKTLLTMSLQNIAQMSCNPDGRNS